MVDDTQQRKDKDQIKLLAVFHFVGAGLALLGIGFLFLHHMFLSKIMANPGIWKGQANGPPKEFFEMFIWFYVLMGVWFVVSSILNVISGLFLLNKQHRMFSLVVAGINCLHMPLGTILGVFTLIILMRDSVRSLYSEEK
ncbi:MAG: hypothetical protein JWM68_2004 [Verrucomicrobiales bacterium]|nr:hypothetical protein [Verrucomicrobiales bacterium]